MMRAAAILLLAMTAAGGAAAQDATKRPYAGQEKRAVTMLSPTDIAQIEAGAGWGLAKSAELNGYPGPAHVLELADKLEITAAQRENVTAIFQKMQAAAIETGKNYISAEARVDAVFRSGKATAEAAASAVAEAAQWRGQLRLVHLNAHLETAEVLSDEQRRRYDHLRGYAGGEPDTKRGHHGHGGHGGHGMPHGRAH
jgi:Spy/CpxP family protein refolding chaperone